MSQKPDSPGGAELETDMSERVKRLLLLSGNCAQTSFSILDDEFDLGADVVLKALTPFPGIALRGETCGAVVGSLMALGLVYGRDDLSNFKGYISSLPPARRFCRQFEAENGSTACAAILQEKLGRNFNLADRLQALEYANAGGLEVCSEVVTSAITIASKALAKERNPHNSTT